MLNSLNNYFKGEIFNDFAVSWVISEKFILEILITPYSVNSLETFI